MTDADRDNPDAETREFLSHPETAEAGRLIMEAVQREGDLGAMLVAGEMLSAFLGDALRKLQPGALEASDLDRLTKGVGPLASWSSRSRVAALVGLISPATLKALDDLREVRNKAAHSEKAFALKTHEVRIRRAFELGPNVSSAVNAMAVETVMQHALNRVQQSGASLVEDLGHNPFEDRRAAAEILSQNAELMAELGDQAWRVELGLGVWLLLGKMRVERDAFLAKIHPDQPMGKDASAPPSPSIERSEEK